MKLIPGKMPALLFVLMVLPGTHFLGIGQDSTFTREHFLKGCVAYREKFVHSIVHAVAGYNMMVDSFKPEITDRRVMERFKENVNRQFSLLGVPVSHELQHEQPAAEVTGDNDLLLLTTEWLNAHSPLIFEFRIMVDNKLIKGDYPYQLLHARELWEEMEFYDFKANDSIVDVGAGNGFLTFLLAYGNFPVTIWMTEIEPYLLVWMKEKAAALDAVEANRIHVVEARENAIGVQPGTADKVIMRITFHHISQPAAILRDVHNVLKTGGFLYITEEPKSKLSKEPQCSKVMSVSKLEKSIKKGGFEIVSQRHGTNIVQYKCRPLKE